MKEVGDLKLKLDDTDAVKRRFEIEKNKVIGNLEIKCRELEEVLANKNVDVDKLFLYLLHNFCKSS